MANPFTPEQISQILEEFFKVVGTRQYIGARYVPIFGRKEEESIEWDNSAPYEPLTIVLYQGNSYTSRQYVPAGVEITNQEFWALTGNYNAQVEQYRQEVKTEKTRAETAEQTLQANIDTEKTRAIIAEDNINQEVKTEKTRAETAEQTLQANIDTEKTRAIIAEDNIKMGYSRVYDTVESMKNDTTIKEGMICKTIGYRAVNDLGGGVYKITTDAPNGYEKISVSNNLTASLIIIDYITPEMLGAYGDNVHDDTNILRFMFNNYNNIKLNGTYLYTENIIANTSFKNINIFGNNSTLTTPNWNAIQINGSFNVTDNINIDSVIFNCSNSFTGDKNPIDFVNFVNIYNARKTNISNCTFNNTPLGALRVNGNIINITDCNFTHVGFSYSSLSTNRNCISCTPYASNLIDYTTNNSLFISNCIFKDVAQEAIDTTNIGTINITNCYGIDISQYFYEEVSPDVNGDKTANVTIENTTFDNLGVSIVQNSAVKNSDITNLNIEMNVNVTLNNIISNNHGKAHTTAYYQTGCICCYCQNVLANNLYIYSKSQSTGQYHQAIFLTSGECNISNSIFYYYNCLNNVFAYSKDLYLSNCYVYFNPSTATNLIFVKQTNSYTVKIDNSNFLIYPQIENDYFMELTNTSNVTITNSNFRNIKMFITKTLQSQSDTKIIVNANNIDKNIFETGLTQFPTNITHMIITNNMLSAQDFIKLVPSGTNYIIANNSNLA